MSIPLFTYLPTYLQVLLASIDLGTSSMRPHVSNSTQCKGGKLSILSRSEVNLWNTPTWSLSSEALLLRLISTVMAVDAEQRHLPSSSFILLDTDVGELDRIYFS